MGGTEVDMGASPLHALAAEALYVISHAFCAMSIREVTSHGIAPRTLHLQPEGKDTLTWVSVIPARVSNTKDHAPAMLNAHTTRTIATTPGYAVGRRILIQVFRVDAQ